MDKKSVSDTKPGTRRIRNGLLVCLAVSLCLTLLTGWLFYHIRQETRILLVNDPLDPLPELLERQLPGQVSYANPFFLAHQIPDHSGITFVFGPQARYTESRASSAVYVPLYAATIVIAVRRDGRGSGLITGWRSLLASDAVVLIPQNGIESGRLAAIALAQALGANEGDLTLAVEAYAELQARLRLNSRDEYLYPGYRNLYNPARLPAFDAIVLWDYQARRLQQISGDWQLVYPEEGCLTVDCGYILADGAETRPVIKTLGAWLQSPDGKRQLLDAGFAPLQGLVDLSAWDHSRLTFNPDFRRQVLGVKRFAPASLQERLIQKILILLLFCLAAWRMLKRIPQGLYREASRRVMLLIVFWMVVGLIKTLPVDPGLTRYCWFATYISRHFLPVCWYAMCYLNRCAKPAPIRMMALLWTGAVILSLLVLSNDLHQLVFIYGTDNPAEYDVVYNNGPGYYLSLLWSFSLGMIGIVLLARKKMLRHTRRQMLYAGILICFLILYQTAYLLEILPVLDLDIPTMIALFYLLFGLAAQRERFMGASLLTLPVLRHSPYAVAVFSPSGQPLYRNVQMCELLADPADSQQLLQPPDQSEPAEIRAAEKTFRHFSIKTEIGYIALLEDITAVRQLEQSLQQTRDQLKAVHALLAAQAREAPAMTSRLERERYTLQMNQLFLNKVRQAEQVLAQAAAASATGSQRDNLRRIRFLIVICQQRLRLLLRSLEDYPLLPATLIERYAAGLIKDGRRVGLDGVLTAAPQGSVTAGQMLALAEAIDTLCLHAFDRPGSSLILHFAAAGGIAFKAYWSAEIELSGQAEPVLSPTVRGQIEAQGGQFNQISDEEGFRISLVFSAEEAAS